MRSYINLTKSHFEPIKLKSKMIYYLSNILQFTNSAKKTWGVMNKLIGKIRSSDSSLSKKLSIEKKKKKRNKRYSRS